MKINSCYSILIVGLGLIGGSYAMALKRKGYRVEAITRSQSSIDYALEHGLIVAGTTEADAETIGRADLIVFALYPHVFEEWIARYGRLIRPGTVLTDVTGVKSCIVYKIQSMLPAGVEFIAAHPMAGREVYGVQNAADSIFRDANFIVVPTENNTPGAIELCRSLGEELGFRRISELTPEAHDKMIAFLSQLTHCIAVALMCSNDDPYICEYTGDSFRDLTRIARINENMWSELFMLNKDELVSQIDIFASQLRRIRDAIETGDEATLKEMMIRSTERRANFDKM